MATSFVSDQIVRARGGGDTDPNVEPLAGIVVRLIHSLILTPDAPPRLHTDEELREFAARYLAPLIRLTLCSTVEAAHNYSRPHANQDVQHPR